MINQIDKDNTLQQIRIIIGKVLIYLCLVFMTLFVLVPFYTVFITSFKLNAEILDPKFSWWPKYGFYIDGYKNVLFTASNFGGLGGNIIIKGFLNTLYMTIPTLIGGLLVSGISAFAFAKLEFPFKDFMFGFLIFTMMIPGVITMTSSYLVFDAIGWINTPLPLMIPGLFGGAGNVFFMRQYFKGIPDDLVNAAKIDGLDNFRIFIKIILPLSGPVFTSLGILGFIGGYNNYIGPLLYLHDPELYTIQIALKFIMSAYRNDMQTVLSASVLSMVLLIIIYIFTQDFIIKGISVSSGLKG